MSSAAIRWVERGGPALVAAPTKSGFGSVLTTATVKKQLGGTMANNWTADGLEVDMVLSSAKLCSASAGQRQQPGSTPPKSDALDKVKDDEW